MALKIARRAEVAPFIAMEVMREANALAAAGASVLHLEVGQPGAPAPQAVLAAARRALGSGDPLGYTEALGLPALRERIARHYRDSYGVAVPAARVVVTTGSSAGFLLGFLSAFDPGDRVGLAAPGYPAYRNILAALGVEPVLLPAGPAEHFQPSPALIDKALPLDGLIVASPANPTGSMLSPAAFRALHDHCRRRGIRFVSDEIYHGITYGEPAETAAAFAADAVVINSFSKYYAMTGWRLGWMVAPEDLLRPIERLSQNLFIAPPTLPQHAALAAFDATDELDANVRRYRASRDLLLAELPRAGFDSFAPADGAFYLYADVAALTNDSEAFCRRMLVETGVAATPGRDFDPERGHHFVRFSFAGGTEEIAEAARRLGAWRR